MTGPNTCPGTGDLRTYAPADITAYSNATGAPSRARTTCPQCAKQLTGPIRRTDGGIPLGERGLVQVPTHKRPTIAPETPPQYTYLTPPKHAPRDTVLRDMNKTIERMRAQAKATRQEHNTE